MEDFFIEPVHLNLESCFIYDTHGWFNRDGGMFMDWQWVKTLEMIMRLELPLGFFVDVPPLGCYELVGFDCRPSY